MHPRTILRVILFVLLALTSFALYTFNQPQDVGALAKYARPAPSNTKAPAPPLPPKDSPAQTATPNPSCTDIYEPNNTISLSYPHPPASPPAVLDYYAG